MFRLVLSVLLSSACAAHAAEGLWPPDKLPQTALRQQYAFEPDADGAERAMRATLRLPGDCTAGFVSSRGLIATSYRCVAACLSHPGDTGARLSIDGFSADRDREALSCPGLVADRLDAIFDVSERVRKATAGLSGSARAEAKAAVVADIEAECLDGGRDDARRCEVVDFYRGSVQQLYRYHRFQDLRLVFAPEADMALRGANGRFPYFAFDVALLRVYEHDRPLRVRDHFPLHPQGGVEGEMVLAAAHPEPTQRSLTVAELETQRDVVLLGRLLYLAELRGLLTRYAAERPEHARVAREDRRRLENSYAVYDARLQVLAAPELLQHRREQEQELRFFVDADPERKRRYGGAWEAIAGAQDAYRSIYARFLYIEAMQGFLGDYFAYARDLVRAAEERAQPDAERLPAFRADRLPALESSLLSARPIDPAFETVKLAWSFSKLREQLGADDPFVRLVLGRESPQTMAARLVEGSALGDAAERRRLWEGGAAAIAQSKDPMIQLARAIDPLARELRARFEEEVVAVAARNHDLIAQAQFEVLGWRGSPEGTDTLRFSYGDIRGWSAPGGAVAPMLRLGPWLARVGGAESPGLPPRWRAALPTLPAQTPLSFTATLDLAGAGVGGPVFDRQGRLVGIASGRNRPALGGIYGYDESQQRAIVLHAGGVIEALRGVYGAEALVEELLPDGGS